MTTSHAFPPPALLRFQALPGAQVTMKLIKHKSTGDFGGPLGNGELSATAKSNTAVPVGPSRPSSITGSPAGSRSSDCDLQLHCRLAQMDSWLGQFATGATGATTRQRMTTMMPGP
jgi:hypothetical protein